MRSQERIYHFTFQGIEHGYDISIMFRLERNENPSLVLGNAILLVWIINYQNGKQEFRRTDFGSRLLGAEGEGQRVSEVKQYPSGRG